MSEPQGTVFGLRIASELPLPDLAVAEGDGPVDVTIRVGAVDHPAGEGVWPIDDGAVLSIDGVARFEVTGGNQITVDPAPEADPADIRLYLLGSAMGLLLYQRGLMPLHANAVVIKGRAVAFAGASGAGKSTLAAWLVSRRLPLLTDDVCVIDRQTGGAMVLPGPQRVRLWRDAIEASGGQAGRHPRSFPSDPTYHKHDVALGEDEVASEPVPLGAIYVLEEGDILSIEPLTGLAAAEALFDHSYRGHFAKLTGMAPEHFRHCVSLASGTPIFRLIRPRRHELMAAQGETILAHVDRLSAIELKGEESGR